MLKWLLHPGASLSRRAVHASIWVLTGRILARALGTIQAIVLARLLTPNDFGLMGISLVVISALEALTRPGFTEALVQRKGRIDQYLDTLWTTGLYRTFTIAVLLTLAAPFIAEFFKLSDARLILQVMAGAVLVRGLTNVGTLHFYRNLEFQKKALNELIPGVVAVTVSVAVALVLRNVWALVMGFFAQSLAQVVISYWSHPYRPSLQLRIPRSRELFAFGRWVYLGGVVNFVSTQADSAILGRLLGPATLGFYQMAQRLSSIPLRETSRALSDVAFPVYSSLQDDLLKLRRALLYSMEVIVSISLPLAIVICLLAKDFVSLTLGEKWQPAVPAIQILSIAGIAQTLAGTSGMLYMAIGKPQVSFQMNLLRALIMVAALYPLTKVFGATGAACAVLVASWASLAFRLPYIYSVLRLSWRDVLRALSPAITAGATIAITVEITKQVLDTGSLLGFLGVVFLIGTAYLTVDMLFWWRCRTGLFSILIGLR